jgi:hypothetical protein
MMSVTSPPRVTDGCSRMPDQREREPGIRRFCLHVEEEVAMGRGILLWLLGIPIPIIILILIFWH